MHISGFHVQNAVIHMLLYAGFYNHFRALWQKSRGSQKLNQLNFDETGTRIW